MLLEEVQKTGEEILKSNNASTLIPTELTTPPDTKLDHKYDSAQHHQISNSHDHNFGIMYN